MKQAFQRHNAVSFILFGGLIFLMTWILVLSFFVVRSYANQPGKILYGYVVKSAVYWNNTLTIRVFDSLERMNHSLELGTATSSGLSAYRSWIKAYEIVPIDTYRTMDGECSFSISHPKADPDHVLYGIFYDLEGGYWVFRVYPDVDSFADGVSRISAWGDICDQGFILKKLQLYYTNLPVHSPPEPPPESGRRIQARKTW